MRSIKLRNRRAIIATLSIVAMLAAGGAAYHFAAAPTPQTSTTDYQCYSPSGVARNRPQLLQPTCQSGDILKAWDVYDVPTTTPTTVGTTTTPTTPTTVGTTTTPTTIATTTTNPPTTTTTTGSGSTFLSYPHQSGPQSFSGSNVVVSNRSYVGFNTKTCLNISNATNVTITNIDFDSCGGDIYLSNVSGNVNISNIRARNTGDGTIGSGHGNVIQFAQSFVNGDVSNVKAFGGDTEDMISVWRSGGVDSAHPLIIENNHLESPLPPSALAWSSGSGTCINVADDDPATGSGGHDIVVRNNTLLNCGSVGLQMNRPQNVNEYGNTVYGTARATSNVGLSQWSSHSCAACTNNFYTNNQVFWQKSGGTASPWWLSGTASITIDSKSKTQDPTTPQVHVTL